jgi:hypothetical protein
VATLNLALIIQCLSRNFTYPIRCFRVLPWVRVRQVEGHWSLSRTFRFPVPFSPPSTSVITGFVLRRYSSRCPSTSWRSIYTHDNLGMTFRTLVPPSRKGRLRINGIKRQVTISLLPFSEEMLSSRNDFTASAYVKQNSAPFECIVVTWPMNVRMG